MLRCNEKPRRKSTVTLEEAKELYPEWYEKRIVQGEPKQKSKKQGGTWVCNEALYEWWKRKITEGSESRRALLFYYGVVLLWLEVWHIRAEDTERRLCVPGPFREPYRGRGQPFQPGRCERRSSGIERGQKKAVNDSKPGMDRGQHKGYDTSKISGITESKRPCKGYEYYESFKKQLGEEVKEGRPKGSGTAEQTVREWQESHPAGKKADCIRETGLSKPTVYKWWK